MNKITAIFARIKNYLLDRLTADTSALLAQLTKLEAKVEKAIAKDMTKLNRLDDMARSIAAAKDAKNRQVDLAYKLLHNVSSLTR